VVDLHGHPRFIFHHLYPGCRGCGGLIWQARGILITLVAFIICVPILVFNPPLSILFVITYTIWAIFGAMIRTLCVTFVILKHEGRQRILALVIYSILAGAAILLSPFLASTLKQSVSFNVVFIAPVLLAVIGFGLMRKYLESPYLPVWSSTWPYTPLPSRCLTL
jgi:MFS family permease